MRILCLMFLINARCSETVASQGIQAQNDPTKFGKSYKFVQIV